MEKLIIKGAREHNLKNIDVEIPRNKLVVISGLSGSGKSSLAFDHICKDRGVMSKVFLHMPIFGRMDKLMLIILKVFRLPASIEQKQHIKSTLYSWNCNRNV